MISSKKAIKISVKTNERGAKSEQNNNNNYIPDINQIKVATVQH